MAGVGDSVVVSRSALVEEDLLGLGKDERSLQELIDSELALRISRAQEETMTVSCPDDKDAMARSTVDFLEAESQHTVLSLDHTNTTNTTNSVSDPTEVDNDWTTVEEVVSRMNNPQADESDEILLDDVKYSEETTDTVCINNNYNGISISDTTTTINSSDIVIDTQTITHSNYTLLNETEETNESFTLETTNIVGHKNTHVENLIQIENDNRIEISDLDDHTEPLDNHLLEDFNESDNTVNHLDNHTDQVDRFFQENHEDHVIHTQHSNNFIVSEEFKESTEKKVKKKKTIVENGEAIVTKTKKKKTKKSEEKENHISVISNGHDINENGPLSPSYALINEDELVNVNVKNLTQSYVNEANKSFNTPIKSSEEPVPPSVPIRELRRSFGDIHTACENADLSFDLDDNQLRARSLGDLRKIERQPVVTGVNVKQLASFWRTISIENISRNARPPPSRLDKSSFSKFDQLSKKTLVHVRSSDPAKAQKTFSQGGDSENPLCKSCGKTVFVMEQIKAERAVWHKNCFRCHTCNKQLTIDIYSSHEGELYCKPHFRELFAPKAVVENEEPASDKPDLGLEELSSLNVKSKFQVFERGDSVKDDSKGPTKVDVKRSPSILSKLAKFQKRGMDVGVTDQDLDGFVYEESSSEEEADEEDDEEEGGVIKCRKVREKPISFVKMDDVKKNWESGATRKEEMMEQKKQDLQNLRSRLFMGKQVKMKEMYEQAVAESEGKILRKESDVVRSDKAKAFREKFEKGEVTLSDEEEFEKNKSVNEDMSVFEEGISKKSRSLFKEMDAKVQATPPSQPSQPKEQKKVSRETDSPERELYRDPTVVRSDEKIEEDDVVKRSQTASKMLSIFRQMEEQKPAVPDGLKPKKEFTPPPDFRGGYDRDSDEESEEESEEEDEESEEDDDGVIKSSHKIRDEFLQGNKMAASAKDIAAKFESWEPERQSGNNAVVMLDSEQPSLESTKSLRAHFESLKNQKNEQESKSRPRVNRFV